jgi:hypothetical protein
MMPAGIAKLSRAAFAPQNLASKGIQQVNEGSRRNHLIPV